MLGTSTRGALVLVEGTAADGSCCMLLAVVVGIEQNSYTLELHVHVMYVHVHVMYI